MSNILKTAGGTLIPISTLVNPTCSQLIQQAVGDISPPPEGRKCEHQSEDVTSLPTSSRTLAQVERVVEAGDDRMDVVPPEVCVDHASVQQSNEDKSVGSSSQSAPSKKNTQHSKSSFLLQELLSSLIFPPSTHLRECLQPHAGSSSLKQALPTPLTLQDNFFWLCTNGTVCVCVASFPGLPIVQFLITYRTVRRPGNKASMCVCVCVCVGGGGGGGREEGEGKEGGRGERGGWL